MTFEEWFTKQVGVAPVPGSFVEAAWVAALESALVVIDEKDEWSGAWVAVNALRKALKAPTSPDQGQGKGQVASQGCSGPSSTACDDQLRGG